VNKKRRSEKWKRDYEGEKKRYTGYYLKIPLNLKPRLMLAAKQTGQSLRGFILTALTNAIEYYERNKPKEMKK